ncbi:unnamed protein product, partial [Sphacelaria rigidula]
MSMGYSHENDGNGFTPSCVDAQNCPCGEAIESRTHIVAECELREEERDGLERETGDANEGGLKSFDAFESG